MWKSIVCLLIILWLPAALPAEISAPFIGGNNFNVDAATTFAADLNDGSTGLASTMNVSLWFELMPYEDRSITPLKDMLSVSLRLANAALYSWRGYTATLGDNNESFVPDYVTGGDQAYSIWFDTIYAQLQYRDYWLRIAGLEPEMHVNQASLFSVFDGIMASTTANDKNPLPLPLFHAGGWYSGVGVTSVIGRDLLSLTNIAKVQQVPVGGMLSAGYDSANFNMDMETGSWVRGADNDNNAWVFGFNLKWKPDFYSSIAVNTLGAVNYQDVVNSSGVDASVINRNPIALGLGYDLRIELPAKMVLKPVIGVDLFYEQVTNLFKWEAGGGLKWYYRGTAAKYSRGTAFGGTAPGGGDSEAALFISANINQDYQMNGLVSFNENPAAALIKNLGGYAQFEFMNIAGINSQPFLWAGIMQLEYKINGIFMPYVSGTYIPGDLAALTYSNAIQNLTTKAGVRITPFKNFVIDAWYERNDVFNETGADVIDNGLVSTKFSISM